jgi:TusA-related sulfurtransferase
MTILKYILEAGAATSGEIIALKRTDPAGYTTLVQWAREQAANQGVVIEESTK